jgi:hypothetical protein
VLASAAQPGTVGAVPEASPAPFRAKSTCCSHKKHDQLPEPTLDGHAGHKPLPSQPCEKCPCKDGSEQAKLALSEATSADLSSFLRAVALDLLASFVAVGAAHPVAEVSHQSDLWLTGGSPPPTDELLFSHHKLRC